MSVLYSIFLYPIMLGLLRTTRELELLYFYYVGKFNSREDKKERLMKIMESYLWTDNPEVGTGVGLELYHSSSKEGYILWYERNIQYLLGQPCTATTDIFTLVRAV